MNCTQVRCTNGYDGGLPQSFVLEAKDNHNYAVVAKIQSSRAPHFNVTGLRPGTPISHMNITSFFKKK